jgi:hypothetical protein
MPDRSSSRNIISKMKKLKVETDLQAYKGRETIAFAFTLELFGDHLATFSFT